MSGTVDPRDEAFMRLAIEEALEAKSEGNDPFGAVVTRGGQVIARGHNLTITDCDPTAHGEVVAIRNACRALNTRRLEGATLYTTCEPCLLCTGAVTHTRIDRVVMGAVWSDAPEYFQNPRKGSLLAVAPHLDLPFDVTTCVLAHECIPLYADGDLPTYPEVSKE
jgi:tRNA(Arg) A34 adenosine deaminase TadA